MMKTRKNITIAIVVLLLILGACKSQKKVNLSTGERGTAKEVYNQAKKYIKRDAEKARLLFKEVMQLYPTSVYARLSKIGIADSYYKERGAAALIMAAAEYQEYVNLYPQSPDAPYALFQVGMCYFDQSRKPGRDQTQTKSALKYFQNMVNRFPETKEADEAKKKIVFLRQRLAAHYFRIGLANYRLRAYKGALERFKQVYDNYPEYEGNDKTFYYTGCTYYKMNEHENAISFFRRVINTYPKSKYIKKSQKMIKKIGGKLTSQGDKK